MVMWQLMNVVRLSFMLNNHFIPRLHALLLWFHSLTTRSSLSLMTTGWQWMENATKVSGSAKCENLACGHGHVKREYFKAATDCRSWTQTIRSLTAACSHCCWANLKCPLQINLLCQKYIVIYKCINNDVRFHSHCLYGEVFILGRKALSFLNLKSTLSL